ncbi:hypothetical protein GCM10008944_27940 [Cytobacillus oceanisediminis]
MAIAPLALAIDPDPAVDPVLVIDPVIELALVTDPARLMSSPSSAAAVSCRVGRDSRERRGADDPSSDFVREVLTRSAATG